MLNRKKCEPIERSASFCLLVLASFLASSLRLLFTSYAWLLVVLSLAKLGHDAVASARSLKSLKSTLQALVFSYYYLCHILVSPPFVMGFITAQGRNEVILLRSEEIVNNISGHHFSP